MADFDPPFAASGTRTAPSSALQSDGFVCGPADPNVFNHLFHRLQSEIGGAIGAAGLTPDDGNLAQLTQAIRILGGFQGGIQFTDVGPTNWTCPANVFRLWALVWGGGGGGGACSGTTHAGPGGGGGAFGLLPCSVVPGQVYTATVGDGGVGGVFGVSNALAGGASSFGPQSAAVLITANGGQPGANSTSGALGLPSSTLATVTGALLGLTGSEAGLGIPSAGGGMGGNSPWGGQGGASRTGAGRPGHEPGGGGSGGGVAGTATVGGAGAKGRVLLLW